MRPKHDEYENDAEFLKFQEMLQASDKCPWYNKVVQGFVQENAKSSQRQKHP